MISTRQIVFLIEINGVCVRREARPGANIYPKAIAAVASGAIDVKSIVTHEFDLDHIKDAYDEAVNNKTDLVKAVIKVK